MRNKAIWTIGAILVIVVLFFLFNSIGSSTNSNSQQTVDNSNQTPNQNQVGSSSQGGTQSPGAVQQSQSATVAYTDNGFSPSSISVPSGTKVTFINSSSKSFWVASDPHPVHTDYPGFDAKRQIPPGQSYSFTFERTGSWGYHNHMNPSQRGTVIVR